MFFDSIYVTYVLMFPILTFLVLPLLLGLLAFIVFLVLRFVFRNEAYREEKREYARFVPRQDASAEITVGKITCNGLIGDISRMGICLKNLPDMVFGTMEQLTITVKAYDKAHRLSVSPKWLLVTASGSQVGVEIKDFSPSWEQFLSRVEKNNLPALG
jgi:hypothetical protein